MLNKTVASIAGLTLVFAAGVASPADAATQHRWNRTQMFYGTAKVGYCSGGTRKLVWPNLVHKDVCKIWFPYGSRLYVTVNETGTVLIDKANCGDSKWLKFTSTSDTSRTAIVARVRADCA